MIDGKIKTQLAADIIKAEGGYTNDPTDHGGATNFGITLATLKAQPGFSAATSEDVKNLRKDQAERIYYDTYITPFDCINNVIIFRFIANAAVQHGIGGAARIIQTALGLKVDGKFGAITRAALQASETADPVNLIADLAAARIRYYTNIIAAHPDQIKFLRGWDNRIAGDLS
jgi:lysozyme family protein